MRVDHAEPRTGAPLLHTAVSIDRNQSFRGRAAYRPWRLDGIIELYDFNSFGLVRSFQEDALTFGSAVLSGDGSRLARARTTVRWLSGTWRMARRPIGNPVMGPSGMCSE